MSRLLCMLPRLMDAWYWAGALQGVTYQIRSDQIKPDQIKIVDQQVGPQHACEEYAARPQNGPCSIESLLPLIVV